MGRAIADLETFLSGVYIPNAGGSVPLSLRADKPTAIRRKRKLIEIIVFLGESFDFADLLSATQVPKPDGFVTARGSEGRAVFRQGKRQNRGGMFLKCSKAFPRVSIPEMDEVIVAAGHHCFAIGGENGGTLRLLGRLQFAAERAGFGVPESNSYMSFGKHRPIG